MTKSYERSWLQLYLTTPSLQHSLQLSLHDEVAMSYTPWTRSLQHHYRMPKRHHSNR
jgi:hypothetical protein